MENVRPTILDEMIVKNFGNPTVMLKKQKTHCFSLLNTSVASERKLEFETKAYKGERLIMKTRRGGLILLKTHYLDGNLTNSNIMLISF